MASGTITLNESTSSGARLASKIVWSSSADTENNTSSVTAKLYVRKYNPDITLTIETTGTWTFALNVNGTSVSGSWYGSVLLDWVLLCTKTVTVSHSDDGSKSITISGSVSGPTNTGFSGHTTSGSGTATLDTIPRASTITSASAVTLGNNCSVKWTPASSSFRYKLKFSLGSWSYTTGAIHPNQTSAYTYTGYTVPLSVASELPSATTGTMTVTLYTYSNSGATTQVGSASSKTFTVTVPNNSSTQPTVSMTLSPVSALSDTFAGLYIQGKTKVKATLSATGKYGATIKSYSMKAEGITYLEDDSYTSDYLTQIGSNTIYGYAKDSRGNVGSTSKEITVIAYSKPQILDVVAARCDSAGTLSDSGTYLKITAKRSYSPVKSGGVQKNFCLIRYRYKVEGGTYSSWTTILASDSLTSDTVETGALLEGVLLATNTYLVQVQAIDDIGEQAYTTITIPTDKVYMHRAGARRAVAFGKYVEEDNCIDIAEDIKLKVRSEKWVSLGLSDAVGESTINTGRAGKGCFYRVVNDNHVFVAFNCSAAYAGASITVSAEQIPDPYKPKLNAYAMCTTNGRGIARVFVNTYGEVRIDYVQNMAASAESTAYTVNWVDGYIDYFV